MQHSHLADHGAAREVLCRRRLRLQPGVSGTLRPHGDHGDAAVGAGFGAPEHAPESYRFGDLHLVRALAPSRAPRRSTMQNAAMNGMIRNPETVVVSTRCRPWRQYEPGEPEHQTNNPCSPPDGEASGEGKHEQDREQRGVTQVLMHRVRVARCIGHREDPDHQTSRCCERADDELVHPAVRAVDRHDRHTAPSRSSLEVQQATDRGSEATSQGLSSFAPIRSTSVGGSEPLGLKYEFRRGVGFVPG